jgi:nickel-type superoxide dismutase maturation protease
MTLEIIKMYKIRDRSMEPALHEGDFVLASSIPLLISGPKKSDIVIAIDPEKKMKIIKRVSSVENGKVFLTGDNSRLSTDSRNFGYVDASCVISKVVIEIKNK